jgi:DNA-binding response OmpR family regulator
MAHILVVDDNEDVVGTIERSLRRKGYQVTAAYDGKQALRAIESRRPDLMILDIMMPHIDGLEVCRRLRGDPKTAMVPVLFLTARGRLEDKIEGFEAGADDYLIKPFEIPELELRVGALLRRSTAANAPEMQGPLKVGALTLDPRTFEVTVGDRTTLLTPVEFELLHYLMNHPDEVISPERLLKDVWGYPPGTGVPDLVRVHIKNLRDKIEATPSNPVYIQTISRHGYTVRPREERAS